MQKTDGVTVGRSERTSGWRGIPLTTVNFNRVCALMEGVC